MFDSNKYIKNCIMLCSLIIGVFIWNGCNNKNPDLIKKVNFEKAEFAPFVEPEFPFITTTVDARQLGPAFPNDNVAPRCLALKLGQQAYACFDTDMLRWAVAWTGEFLPMVTMAQISYRDFHNKGNKIPEPLGTPQIATGLYPGWMGANPSFTDPRPPAPNPKGPSWGPISPKKGRWNGVYLQGDQVVLSYTVRGTNIYEKPGSIKMKGTTAFTRTFQIKDPHKILTLVAAEVSNGKKSEVKEHTAFIYQGENNEMVTAIGLVSAGEGPEIKIIDNQYAIVKLPASKEQTMFTAVMWHGSADSIAVFNQLLDQVETDMPAFKKGSEPYWTQTVHTKGQISPDTAAYVTDILTLPIPNPWKRNVRVADIDFFKGDSAAVVTFAGDVWIIKGIDKKLDHLKWRRYASGLYSPQSIEIVDEQIYVFTKAGIIRFKDLNGDGVADYYESFSNLMTQSIESREWAADMVAAPSGGFYIAKGAALNAGPPTHSPTVAEGFRAGSRHSGSILKVSADGQSIKTIATGLRGPYLGINPETGVLSASDQQGNFVPTTPIYLIDEGDYFGVPATAHRKPIPDITPPLLWIPHKVDRSGMSQVWTTGDKMGPLNGHMIHISYGRPGLFKVLIDSTGEKIQGGLSYIEAHYPAPTMKGTINPRDGQLYVAGFSLWGSNVHRPSALIRLRYTGKPALLPESFDVYKKGIVLRFDVKLDKKTATNAANYKLKRWNYKRTEKYGSGHYKLNGEPGEEILPIYSVHLSDDKRAVFLAVPNMEKVMQMQLSYTLKSTGGIMMDKNFWFTVHDMAKLKSINETFSNIDIKSLTLSDNHIRKSETEVKPASIKRGKQLFKKTGCMSCHTVKGKTSDKLGPPLQGLFGSKQKLKNGSTVVVDESYIRESILHPGKKVVKGYKGEMPSFLGILSDNEVKSIVLYIRSLSD